MSAGRPDTTLEELVAFVKASRGFDFTGYKRTTIQRRLAKRMAAVDAERYEDYLDYLELHGEEFAELFNALLINTTGFFRDPQTWEYMAIEIVPQLLATRTGETPIRVWSAGCASGEEPYTVAMVLARVMGDSAVRDRVKIYATDVDDETLDFARHGAYAAGQIEEVPADALERFFERTDQRCMFRRDLRRSVIFGRNDLVQDAPISRPVAPNALCLVRRSWSSRPPSSTVTTGTLTRATSSSSGEVKNPASSGRTSRRGTRSLDAP
jgi:two-component system CheB/CheR fusion protein